MVAVVAGEHEDGLAAAPGLLQCVQHAPDGIVDAGDHAASQRARLLRLARRHADRVHAVEIGRACLALGNDVAHERRRRPVVALERFRHRKLLGLVHVPVLARRVERVVRIGKRHHEKERLADIGCLHKSLCLLADEGSRIELGRNGRAVGLRQRVFVRQGVPQQCLGLGIALGKPAGVIAAAILAVRAHQRDVIEAVERRLDSRILEAPVFRRLLLVSALIEIIAQRLHQIAGRFSIACARRCPFDDRRPGREVLQVTLADQRGAVT